MMKNTFIAIFSFLLLALVLPCQAMKEVSDTTSKGKGKPLLKLAYDANFEMNFDNREYDPSPLAISATTFGARLTPSVGLDVIQSNGMKHRLMLGIDIMKDFGRSPSYMRKPSGENVQDQTPQKLNNWDLFREMLLYYRYDAIVGKTDINLTAGIFPRSFSDGKYPRTFFSDSVKFYDNNLEGVLLGIHRPKSYYEIGIDWMGMYGDVTRERFMIFLNGHSQPLDFLSLGYSAYVYHYAGCRAVWGVVDNILVNPWIGFDFAYKTGFQKLGFTLGGLFSAQNDRRKYHKYVFPMGGELNFEARRWNVGLHHTLYVGGDLMPYYWSTDAEGYLYANQLYFGDTFYRTEPGRKICTYNRLEVYYQPHLADFVDLKLSVTAHFHQKYSGLQQQVSLIFNLQKLLDGGYKTAKKSRSHK